ncbi:uncharacterized protein LOC132391738 isoform X1 [Hypanus sabinus]|uniref:uncharacterized protein LOC132391738 isoform X1 n=1 Tax=Hypanus sabinus TaxID=79690 RepID=UPI0028C4651A|nr:uncharacterized protein LOC132391738 isoform X1 [Hypanus sabinus]XP_059821282.1 uncharacterized protein LOC132391738 isoform X1 [Hypanus sabinus]
MDTDSGILSSCSNISSSETYKVGKEMLSAVGLEDVYPIGRYDRQSERKVALTLLQSESRRCTLTECLQTAWCTLKEQRERICKKDMEVVNHSAVIDSMILKQKLLETKVGLLLKEEGTSYGVRLDEARRGRELQNRIWCLEEEIEHFNQKLGQLTSKRRDPEPTMSCYLTEENREPKGQPQNYLQTLSDSLECRQEHWNFKEMNEGGDPASNTHEEDLRELASCLVDAENGKASLENQVSELHTQLFQTKCESYGLKKQRLESELQLTANRNINESLLWEITRLKQSLQALEQQIVNLPSEKTTLSSQLKTLESEQQQLSNEKKLLVETLKGMKCLRCSDSLLLNQFDGRVSAIDLHNMPSKSCPQCKFLPTKEESTKDNVYFNDWEQMGDVKEEVSTVSNSIKATGTELQRTDMETEQQLGNILIFNQDHQENGKAWKDLRYSGEGLQQPNTDPINTRNNINLKVEELLEKIEDFTKLNLKLENDIDQILCKLRMQTAEAKGLELSNEWNRKQLLHLLSKNIDLRHENQIKANQLTVLIIELHHSRKAYQTLSQSTNCPEDTLSAEWINRLRLIKNAVKKIETQQLKLNLLKKENEELMEKSELESLRNMDAKLRALNASTRAKIQKDTGKFQYK